VLEAAADVERGRLKGAVTVRGESGWGPDGAGGEESGEDGLRRGPPHCGFDEAQRAGLTEKTGGSGRILPSPWPELCPSLASDRADGARKRSVIRRDR
jgi:hypothetical protein